MLVVWVPRAVCGTHLVSDVHSDFRVPFFALVRSGPTVPPLYAMFALLEESVLAAFADHMALRLPNHAEF